MLGHKCPYPRLSMVCCIINNYYGHPLKNQKIMVPNDCNYIVCLQDKLIIRLFLTRLYPNLQSFKNAFRDICGPIDLSSGFFYYFIILIDASNR